jgi:hypothetical protein
MRKFQAALCGLLILWGTMAFAAAGDVASSYVTQENAQANFVALTAATNTATLDVGRALPSNHAVLAVVTGGPATCTISLQGTIDGVTWDTISSATTCTSSVYFYASGKPVSGIRANLTALTGGTSPTVTVYYVGSHGASSNGGATTTTSGTASAITQAGYPMICDTASSGTVTAGQAQMVRCNTSGSLALTSGQTVTDGVNTNGGGALIQANGGNTSLIVIPKIYNGGTTTGLDMFHSASLTNYTIATTLTARNQVGSLLTEKSSRWSVISNPAAGSQATASIASEASVRHVVDCVSFSAAATAAPAATALTINIRDGASGAGTIIWTFQTAVTATTGQLVQPHSICGLNLVGTTATAMTAEFSASLANLIESVSISGFNVN